MVKQWTCAQCGTAVERGLLGSLMGGPEECDACGNTEFESPLVVGPVHRTLDAIIS